VEAEKVGKVSWNIDQDFANEKETVRIRGRISEKQEREMKITGIQLKNLFKKLSTKGKRKIMKKIKKDPLHRVCAKTYGGARSTAFAQGMSYFRRGR
jgi:hypothetical protein